MEVDFSQAGLWTLIVATFTLATTHTVSPDHWFPFVMVGRANKWKSFLDPRACRACRHRPRGNVCIDWAGGGFAENGVSKDIATFLENATPMLLIVFGFGYAAYALYKEYVGDWSHLHGIPIVNKWLGINATVYELPGQGEEEIQDARLGIVRRVIIYLHKLNMVTNVAHDDHMHSFDATTEKDHEHRHYHGELLHEHKHKHRIPGDRRICSMTMVNSFRAV